ncbi:MAG: hypothetical protein KDA46_05935 [Parvularculaceae bacterium]|nr:hypothetical protein [Parvularculaceae bacterium]
MFMFCSLCQAPQFLAINATAIKTRRFACTDACWFVLKLESKGEGVTFDLVLGLAAVAFGLATLAARLFGWEKLLGKRAPMKERYGESTGDIIHLVAYSLVPLACGGVLTYLAATQH